MEVLAIRSPLKCAYTFRDRSHHGWHLLHFVDQQGKKMIGLSPWTEELTFLKHWSGLCAWLLASDLFQPLEGPT